MGSAGRLRLLDEHHAGQLTGIGRAPIGGASTPGSVREVGDGDGDGDGDDTAGSRSLEELPRPRRFAVCGRGLVLGRGLR
jgi:hypothetical protein